ncbi:MFS transporter [Schaalia turicensis]|uniref:MFS transporter n=1 Tax=Schaalia turicensis TaxID=131111 RepID=UPI0034A30E17
MSSPERDMTASPKGVASSTDVKPRRVSTLSTVMALVAVLAISPSMRAGATSLGPILTAVQSTFGVGAMAVGLLSALPCIVFSLVGVLAVPLSKRFGLTCIVTVAMAVTTFGLGVRPFVSNYWAFLLLSVAGLAGPAVGNVIVPAWIKLHKAGRTVLLLTVYGGVLPLGGAMGSFLGAPIAGPDSSGWRTALFIWAPWALLAVLVWLLAWKSVGRDTPPVAQSLAPVPESSTPLTGDEAAQLSSPLATNRRSLMRSPTAVALMVAFGLQSLNAYVQFGQLPTILAMLGVDRTSAAAMVAAINLWALVGGLIMPKIVDSVKNLPLVSLLFGVLTASGYLGLLLAPTFSPWLWVTLLSIGGFMFPLCVTLIPARARTASMSARLSGMAQPGAYIVAAFGPIIVGMVLQATASTTPVLIFLMIMALLMGIIGMRASAPVFVDDEV